MIYKAPSTSFEATLEGAPTGLTGTIGVRINDGQGATTLARSTSGIVESPAGSGVYTATLVSPSTLGHYIIVWDTGSVSPTTTSAEDLEVTYSVPVSSPSGPTLITLDEYKNFLGYPLSNTTKDAKYNFALSAATSLIRNYTDRDFGLAEVTEERTYDYDCSGIIDVDDCHTITSVVVSYPQSINYTVPSELWRAAPTGESVATYIEIIGNYGAGSPEMGFTWNADVLAREGRLGYFPAQVHVTATYGWPTVPDDVKMATAITAANIGEKAEAVQSESIAGYSYTMALDVIPMSVPARAKEILDHYARIKAVA